MALRHYGELELATNRNATMPQSRYTALNP